MKFLNHFLLNQSLLEIIYYLLLTFSSLELILRFIFESFFLYQHFIMIILFQFLVVFVKLIYPVIIVKFKSSFNLFEADIVLLFLFLSLIKSKVIQIVFVN